MKFLHIIIFDSTNLICESKEDPLRNPQLRVVRALRTLKTCYVGESLNIDGILMPLGSQDLFFIDDNSDTFSFLSDKRK